MNSGEVARLAGVSVRTLRHYHQIGVLPEPPRAANGYRRYRVGDLVRLLRIKRLAGLGIPLDRISNLLDGVDDPPELLDQLDRELAADIERLTRQREVIARIRAEGLAPDVPPELGRFFAVFGATDISPALTAADRDQSVLLAHLVGEQGMPQLAAFYEMLASAEFAPRVAAFARRFEELTPESGPEQVDALFEEFIAVFGSAVIEVSESGELPDIDPRRVKLLDDLRDEHLNEAQRAYLARVIAYFG